jgi:hypothetical protein
MLSHDVLNYHPLHNEVPPSIKRDGFLKFINHLGHEAVEIDFNNL